MCVAFCVCVCVRCVHCVRQLGIHCNLWNYLHRSDQQIPDLPYIHTYRPCIYPYLPKSKYFTCLLIIRYSAVAGYEKAGQNSSTVWTGHRSFVYKNSRWPTQLVCCLSPLPPPPLPLHLPFRALGKQIACNAVYPGISCSSRSGPRHAPRPPFRR